MPYRLADAHGHRQRLALLVHRHEHARLRGHEQVVQHVVVLAEQRMLHVQHGERVDDQPRQRNVGVQRAVRIVETQVDIDRKV